jgi:hypothetical protein
MAKATTIRGQLYIKEATLPSGTGDELLTIDASTGQVRKISTVPLSTTLASGNIFVGNGSNIATGVALTGVIGVNSLGVASFNAGVIVNADVNASAAISLTKLAATTASKAIVSGVGGFLEPSATTAAQVGYLSTTTSDVQIQIDSKQATITGGATTITSANLTPNRALIANSSGKVGVSTITDTELGHLSGSSSNLQTQIDNKLTVSLSSPTDGDIYYRTGGTVTNLGIGSNGQVLTVSAGLPSWQNGTSNGIPSGGTANQYLTKIDGTNYNVQWSDLTLSQVTGISATEAEINILSGTTVTAAELEYVAGATSNLQTQISSKLNNTLTYHSIFVGNSSDLPSQLSAGSDGAVLTIVSGHPTWQAPPTPGTFSGPISSTDNAIVRFNGTGGNAGQDSGVIIDDTNNVSGVATLSTGQVSVLDQATIRLYETGSTNYVGLRASGVMGADYTITLPAAAPGANTFLKYDGANYVWDVGGGGATDFTDLADVPSSYTGHALKVVRVNAGETALEFSTAGTGTVTSVTGTADRITVATGTTTPVLDIAATYVGQASITTLGTIGTGTWNATNISLAKGGTGVSLSDPGADRIMFWDESANAVDWLSNGSSLSISGTTISVATNGIDDSHLRQSSGLSVIGNSTSSTANVADITAASDHQVLRRSGTSLAFGAVNLASSNAVTGILPIANGGTGSATQNFWATSGGSTVTTPTITGIPTFAGNIVVQTDSLGTTQVANSGLVLTNTIAAAAGAQQISPAVRWLGSGWKTTATAASQNVEFRAYVTPVQGTTAPSGTWTLESAINGGSFGNGVTVSTAGAVGIPSRLSIANTASSGNVLFSVSKSALSFSIEQEGKTKWQGSSVALVNDGFLDVSTTIAIGLGGVAHTSLFSIRSTVNSSSTATDTISGIRVKPTWALAATTPILVGFDYDPTVTGTPSSRYGILIRSTSDNNGFGTATPVSTVEVQGSFGAKIQTVTSNTTIGTTHHTVLCDATSAGFTITLPTAASSSGRIYIIKKIDATVNVVTIDGDGSETIDGATTQSLSTQWQTLRIQSNGTSWYVI